MCKSVPEVASLSVMPKRKANLQSVLAHHQREGAHLYIERHVENGRKLGDGSNIAASRGNETVSESVNVAVDWFHDVQERSTLQSFHDSRWFRIDSMIWCPRIVSMIGGPISNENRQVLCQEIGKWNCFISIKCRKRNDGCYNIKKMV
jgi:hypothetical protein